MASVLAIDGKFDKAKKFVDKALGLNPHSTQVLLFMFD